MIETYNHEGFIEQASVSVREQDSHPRSEKRPVIPAFTHVDGSAGPQTVEKRINLLCLRLTDEFEQHAGVPVFLNTACNLRGRAIVDTPTDANRTFFSFGMDALLRGSFPIEK
jgi:carbamoyltransferase